MSKPRKCDVCGEPFEKQRIGQKVCDYRCAVKLPQKQRDKAFKAVTRAMKTEFNKKQKSWWNNEKNEGSTAYWFHRWVRFRDAELPCVSCCKTKAYGWHASHFRSRGAAGHLRYTPDNCHKSCHECNSHKSGNIGPYRIELVRRIGLERVEALENDNEVRRWTVEELEQLRDRYRDLTKELEAS